MRKNMLELCLVHKSVNPVKDEHPSPTHTYKWPAVSTMHQLVEASVLFRLTHDQTLPEDWMRGSKLLGCCPQT